MARTKQARKATPKAERKAVGKAEVTGAEAPVTNGALKVTSSCKKRRWRAGTLALREIRRQQKSVELLMRRKPFRDLVRELASECCNGLTGSKIRFKASAFEALQCAAEAHTVNLFRRAQHQALHAKRVTVQAKDLTMARVYGAGVALGGHVDY